VSERSGADDAISQHPADRLIRLLIETERPVTGGEVDQIRERVAVASFGAEPVVVKPARRGMSYLGRTLAGRDDPLFVHLVERVLRDRQWVEGTTAHEYVDHLQRAVRSPASQLAIYRRRGGAIVAALHRTVDVIPADRLGQDNLPVLVVIYSADRGILVTGYQASSLEAVSIPEDARWLA
jgi:hypothetical protein